MVINGDSWLLYGKYWWLMVPNHGEKWWLISGVKWNSGWWLTYPSEKYELVSWDDDIPNWMEKQSKCSKPPTSFISCVFEVFKILFRGIHFSGNQHSTSFWYWQCISPHGLEPSPDLFQQSFSKLNLFRFLNGPFPRWWHCSPRWWREHL